MFLGLRLRSPVMVVSPLLDRVNLEGPCWPRIRAEMMIIRSTTGQRSLLETHRKRKTDATAMSATITGAGMQPRHNLRTTCGEADEHGYRAACAHKPAVPVYCHDGVLSRPGTPIATYLHILSQLALTTRHRNHIVISCGYTAAEEGRREYIREWRGYHV